MLRCTRATALRWVTGIHSTDGRFEHQANGAWCIRLPSWLRLWLLLELWSTILEELPEQRRQLHDHQAVRSPHRRHKASRGRTITVAEHGPMSGPRKNCIGPTFPLIITVPAFACTLISLPSTRGHAVAGKGRGPRRHRPPRALAPPPAAKRGLLCLTNPQSNQNLDHLPLGFPTIWFNS